MPSPPNLALDRSLLKPGERVAVAVSGGADSVALLLALARANHERRNGRAVGLGVGLSAVHVHHGIRGGEADGDEAFVRALCELLGVRLVVERVDVPRRVAERQETLEEAARELRYEVFRRLLETGEADAVATAHTRDDQAETVLMKLVRGAWTEGLSGIHPVLRMGAKGRVVRPLLGVSRAEVEAFLRGMKQEWREDSSNQDAAFTRNRVRHELLPLLRRENPQVDVALANVAEIARGEQEHWEAEMERNLAQMLVPGRPVRGGGRANSMGENCVAIELERLRGMSAAMRRRVVRAMAKTVGSTADFDGTSAVLARCFDGETRGKRGVLELRDGLRAEVSVRELRLFRKARS
jgi:tRNA(Ile)-lysidine synthase